MIYKKRHLYFAKEIDHKYLNMNVDLSMEVEEQSDGIAKAFKKWVKQMNDEGLPKVEQDDIGFAIEYEILEEDGSEIYEIGKLTFNSCRAGKGLNEKEKVEIEVFLNKAANELDKILNKKDQS